MKAFHLHSQIQKKNIKDIITPKDELINIELGLEEIESSLAPEFFFCFPFVTRSLNYVPSFSIYLQDDKNKEIEINSGEQKVSIFNFQVDIYLR